MNGGQPMRSGGRPGRRRAGRRPVLGPLLLGLLMAASVLVTARPSAPAAFGADAEPAVDPDVQGVLSERWGRRLAELDPSRPLAYLELAEEIDDARLLGPAAAGDPVARAERGLVLRLCGLAARLDSAIAPAAARAVADLSEDARERRRLLAVADLLEGDRLLRGREVRIEGVPTGRGGAAPSEVLLAASEAIARQRRGEGERALDPLARYPRDQVAAVFEPWPGGLAGFEQDCRRRPGGMTLRRFRIELAAERRMLEGDATDWSSIARTGGGDPLEEVDADDLQRLFPVDASRPRWRDGQWVP
ncbi:MAG: hypothetical protein ACYTEV_11285 [Planctomycetota bacterium]